MGCSSWMLAQSSKGVTGLTMPSGHRAILMCSSTKNVPVKSGTPFSEGTTWLWWVTKSVKGEGAKSVKVMAVLMSMILYDTLHAQRATCSSSGVFCHLPSHCFFCLLDISMKGTLIHTVIPPLNKV